MDAQVLQRLTGPSSKHLRAQLVCTATLGIGLLTPLYNWAHGQDPTPRVPSRSDDDTVQLAPLPKGVLMHLMPLVHVRRQWQLRAAEELLTHAAAHVADVLRRRLRVVRKQQQQQQQQQRELPTPPAAAAAAPQQQGEPPAPPAAAAAAPQQQGEPPAPPAAAAAAPQQQGEPPAPPAAAAAAPQQQGEPPAPPAARTPDQQGPAVQAWHTARGLQARAEQWGRPKAQQVLEQLRFKAEELLSSLPAHAQLSASLGECVSGAADLSMEPVLQTVERLMCSLPRNLQLVSRCCQASAAAVKAAREAEDKWMRSHLSAPKILATIATAMG
jgi:hypothetical protein